MTTKTKSQEKNKMSEIDDQILKYFDIKKRLGKGAYGIVWKAIDKKSNQIVAVKKIFDAFRNETDAQRTFREIMFLRAFRNHPNVIQLHSIYKAANNLDIYLSFEFMESDLHNVIKRGTILKDVHKRYVMYQLFNAIKYIHSGNVIHRDLKPSNVLIDSKCRCKIADFGLARSVSQRQLGESNTSVEPVEQILTDYVATRWYRAPEILVASKRYTKGIDMWSLGCILGEMIRGKPLFPGSSTVNQIEKIVAALPEVTEKDVAAVGSSFGSVLLNQQINSNSTPKLDELLTAAPEDARNLVKSLLVLDPSCRLTAKQALSHKYIEKFRHTIPEAELNSDVLPPFRDDVQLTVPEYRSKLYEIMKSSEKHANGPKNSSRKKEFNNHIRPDNSITVISSANNTSIAKKPLAPKSDDIDKRDNQFVKPFEKRTLPSTSQNNAFFASPPSAAPYKNTKTSTNPSVLSSTTLTDNKVQAIPKVKYCKIPNMTDSKLNSACSERSEIQQNKSLMNHEKINFPVEKRHSIDCGYSAEISLGFGQTGSMKTHSFNNAAKPNSRGMKYSKIKTEEVTVNPTTINKYVKKCFTPEEPLISNSQKGDGNIDKSPPLKMTKAEILAMSSDSGSYYERRLKSLEERIQRHKMDIKVMLAQNAKHKSIKAELEMKHKVAQATISGEKLSKAKVPLARSKSENAGSRKQGTPIKYDYTFPEGDRLSSKRKGSDYGVITAKGLFDLRKYQVTT